MGRNLNGDGTIRRLPDAKGGKPNYQCSIQTKDETGKKKMITATARTQTEARKKARKKLEEYEIKLKQQGSDAIERKTHKIKDDFKKWFDTYAALHWQFSTKASRWADLSKPLDCIGDTKVKDITASGINNMIAECLTDTNRRSMGMVYSILRDYFHSCVVDGVISKNPFEEAIKLPSTKKGKNQYKNVKDMTEEIDWDSDDEEVAIFTDEEVDILKEGANYINLDGTPMYWRLPVYLVMLNTGMRGQEVRALTINDIDFEQHTIRISKAIAEYKDDDGNNAVVCKVPKTISSKRVIGITAETERYLKLLIKRRPENTKCKWLYCTKTGKPISRNNFARDFNLILKGLDIEKKGRHPHSLRHTFASLALEGNEKSPLKDKPALFISQYLGHSDLSTTYRIYAHLDKAKLKNIKFADEPKILEIDFSFDE